MDRVIEEGWYWQKDRFACYQYVDVSPVPVHDFEKLSFAHMLWWNISHQARCIGRHQCIGNMLGQI